VKKRIVVAVVLAVLMAASAYAQTTDFFALAKTGTAQQIQAAIDQGADVNARSDGAWTALMLAALYNPNPEVIATLLKAGADVKGHNVIGLTPLMFAAVNQNPEVISTLLKAGADAKAKDRDGKTAFDYAQKNEKLKGTDAYRQLEEASQVALGSVSDMPLQKLTTFPSKYINKSIKLEPCWMDANGIKAVDKKTFFTVFFADMGLHVTIKEWYGWESPCALVDAETAEKLVDYAVTCTTRNYPVNIYGTVRRDKDLLGSGDIYNLLIDKIEILSLDDLTTAVETFNCTWK
jgi:hypothetical protein